MISTRDLSGLPDIPTLKRLAQSLAVLEAILMPEWEMRYYSYQSVWSEHVDLFKMRNGSGDDFFILFAPEGAIIKGFAHESPMSPYAAYASGQKIIWAGVLDDVPLTLKHYLTAPSLVLEDITFCVWRTTKDTEWRRGKIDFPDDAYGDGSKELLFILDGNPSAYQTFAEEYYEVAVELDAVKHIYDHRPVTKEIAQRLNPDIEFDKVSKEIAEIGYLTVK